MLPNKTVLAVIAATVGSLFVYWLLGERLTTYLSVGAATIFGAIQLAMMLSERFRDNYLQSLSENPVLKIRLLMISANWAAVISIATLILVGWIDAAIAVSICLIAGKIDLIRAEVPGGLALFN